MLLLVGSAVGANAADRYVAPNGGSKNNGAMSSPWDLQTAFFNAAPGDTVWLRGGNYNGTYTCWASGNSSAQITFRQYPGERATVVGPSTLTPTITLQCHNVTFWGFEIYSSDPKRLSSQTGSFPTDIQRGAAIEGSPDGSYCKLVNMVIHDDFNSFIGNQAAQFETYGSLFYFQGWDAPDRGHGHALYSQNNPNVGTKRIVDNVMFDAFAEGLHVYAQTAGYMSNYDIEGNAVFNSGEPSATTGYTTDIIIGGSTVAPTNVTLLNNYTYHSPVSSQSNQHNGRAVWLGSTTGCSGFVVQNNYFVDQTGNAIRLESGCKPVMTGNTFFGTLTGITTNNYPSNSYYTSKPKGVNVFVRPNQYEAGRANIIIYNWDGKSSVDADVSAVLKSGDSYRLQDAQNFYGPSVVQGTYYGGTINIPTAGGSIASMVGNPPIVPQHTSSEFGVYVLLTTGSGSSGPAPVSSNGLPNGVYAVTNASSNMVLDDPGASSSSGVQIIQWTPNGGSNQKWQFTASGNGYYRIQNVASGLYLACSGGSGSPLQQQTSSNGDQQLWSLTSVGGMYLIQNKAMGTVIADPAGSSAKGIGMTVESSTGSTSQHWSIQ